MNYFFDESGNWSGYERRRLVLGGLIIPDNNILNRLSAELSLLRSEHNLSYLHAAEMSNVAKEDTYQIICNCLEKGAKAYLRTYSPRILFRSTRMSFEEVYIDLASSLVSQLILGDKHASVSYDMKFHYAYPLNIINEIKIKKPYHYERIQSSLALKPHKLDQNKNRILFKLGTIKNKPVEDFQWYLELLASNPEKAIVDYLWSELVLQVQGKEQARELFRAQILSNLKRMLEQLYLDVELPELRIAYMAKENKNAGIEMIDFLNNLVYINGTRPNAKASTSVRKIYSLIRVEEIRV